MTDNQDIPQNEFAACPNTLAQLEQALNSLVAGFSRLSGHRLLPVEPEFKRLEGSEDHKAIVWEAESFTADTLEYGVIARLTGEAAWSRCVFVCPAADTTTPILLLLLQATGDTLTFIAVDLIPLCERDNGVMDEVAMGYETLGTGTELPATILAAVSRSPIIRHLAARTPPSTIINLIQEVSALWMEYAQSARRETDVVTRQTVAEKRVRVCQAHANSEWLRNVLSQAFGKSLSEKLLTQVIFRQERFQAAANTR